MVSSHAMLAKLYFLLACFATDFGQQSYPNRVNIPLPDGEAHVTFYLAEKERKIG